MSEPDQNPVENLSGIFQAIDANLNRCIEGLRVAEEVFRFVQTDHFLARQLKDTRHLLAEVGKEFSRIDLIQSRDGHLDVGREIVGSQEMSRDHLSNVLNASFSRAAEAARVLEEFSKLVQPDVATRCESIRYRIYDLQKASELAIRNKNLLEKIHICILVDAKKSNDEFIEFITGLGDWPKMIQLRDKDADDATLVERGKTLTQLTRNSDSIWIMNDRADLAVACSADGVHLGQDDLTVSDARRIVGPRKLIGVSTHHVAQVEQAVMDGASYIGVGPTFTSQTKSFTEFAGTNFVRTVAEQFSIPAFAIGGIDDTNVSEVIEAGGLRVALSQAAQDANVLEKIRSALHAIAVRAGATGPSQ